MLDLDNIATELRNWTKGHDNRVRAAVELLIEHDHWLWDEGFTGCCIVVHGGVTCLDFAAMRRYHDEGPPCSDGQAAILLVAADLGSGRWKLDILDGRNRQRVADAVSRAMGLTPDA